MEVNNGMRLGERRQVADYLQILLPNIYMLAIKTQTYHWNVTGQHFKAIHDLFDSQYRALFDLSDTIAERIRQLGFPVVHTVHELDRAFVKPTNDITTTLTMIARLTKDHEEIMNLCRDALKSAEQNQDPVTIDTVTRVMVDVEKMAWMLRATKHDTKL